MNKTVITHVAAEAIVLGSLTVYLLNRIASLEQRLAQVELDVQIVARKEARVEEVHTTAIKNLASMSRNTDTERRIEPNPVPMSSIRAPLQPSSGSGVKYSQQGQKKVTFSTHEEEEDDEELLAREFANEEPSDVEDEEDEESEEKPQRPAVVTKSRKPNRRAITPSPKAPPERRGGKNMDDTRAMAEKLRKEAGAEAE
jgi:hypothetical protein